MARSLSTLKVMITSMISNQVSGPAARRRGFGSAVEGSRKNVMMQKVNENETSVSWIPDPVTGYYRPENVSNEIDVVELRELLLNQNKRKKKN